MTDRFPWPRKCMVCDKSIGSDHGSGLSSNPLGAIEFDSYGNYGSTVFDSFGTSQIVIVICDECVNQRRDRIIHIDTQDTCGEGSQYDAIESLLSAYEAGKDIKPYIERLSKINEKRHERKEPEWGWFHETPSFPMKRPFPLMNDEDTKEVFERFEADPDHLTRNIEQEMAEQEERERKAHEGPNPHPVDSDEWVHYEVRKQWPDEGYMINDRINEEGKRECSISLSTESETKETERGPCVAIWHNYRGVGSTWSEALSDLRAKWDARSPS